MSAVEAVVFDLDGVLADSEQVWDEVREQPRASGKVGGTNVPRRT